MLPRIWTRQPPGVALLTPEFFDRSELCFLPNSLHIKNLAKSNPGKVLTRVSPVLKGSLAGCGVGCSDTTHAFGDSDWIDPIATSNGTGTGAFSLLINATLASAAARTIPFIIRQNSGNYNTVLVLQNGYGPEGGSSGISESGTVYIGSLDSGAASYRGLKLASALTATPTPITLLYNRYADGTSSLWANGVLAASNATGYLNDLTVGTAMMLSIGGAMHSAGFATPDPTNLIYSANRSFSAAESARLSRNPWQIFQAPQRKLWASVGGASDHSLTGNGITTSAATLGTPALTQDHAVVGAAISTSAATLGTPAITQDHVITAAAIATGAATLGSPALSGEDAHALTADAITTAAAILGTPGLTQDHALIGGAIAAGPPTFGPVTLEQQHVLLATGITTSPATLGTPALSGELFTAEQLAYLLAYMQENLMIPTAAENAAAVIAAAQAAPIHAEIKMVAGSPITGSGTPAAPWGP